MKKLESWRTNDVSVEQGARTLSDNGDAAQLAGTLRERECVVTSASESTQVEQLVGEGVVFLGLCRSL